MRHKLFTEGEKKFVAIEISEDMSDFDNNFSGMLFFKNKYSTKSFAYLSSDCSSKKKIVGKLSELSKEKQLDIYNGDLKTLIESKIPVLKNRKSKVDYLILTLI